MIDGIPMSYEHKHFIFISMQYSYCISVLYYDQIDTVYIFFKLIIKVLSELFHELMKDSCMT